MVETPTPPSKTEKVIALSIVIGFLLGSTWLLHQDGTLSLAIQIVLVLVAVIVLIGLLLWAFGTLFWEPPVEKEE